MKKLRSIGLLILCLAAAFCLSGCGVSHKSPESVVKSLVKYYEQGNESKVAECYGFADGADDATKAEIQSVITYFKTMGSKGITLVECDVIQDYNTYSYVYISYEVNLGKNKSYPKLETFLVSKKDKGYYVIPSKDITTEMSTAAKTAYTTFMTTDPYKEYIKSYDAFMLKNAGFEEELATKLK